MALPDGALPLLLESGPSPLMRSAGSPSSLGLLAGTFVVLFGAGGFRQSYGIFIYPWEQSLGADRGQVALVAAVFLLMFGVVQPLAGRMIDVHGPRWVVPGAILLAAAGCLAGSRVTALWQLAIVYGIGAAVGFGALSNAPMNSIVARHFESRRGLALGLCSTGTPLGIMLLLPLLALGMQQNDWRWTMAAMGVTLIVVVLPLSWLFLRQGPAQPFGGAPAPSHSVRDALTSRGYQLLAGGYLICGMTTVGLIQTHLVPHAIDLGIPQVQAAGLLGVIGLVNAIGLLASGWAADRWGARLPLVAVYAARAIALVWLAAAVDETMLLAFAVVFGMTDMATIPLVAGGTASLFGRQSMGALFGLAALGHQIGSALGAWLGGQGYLLWGSYQPVILIGAGMACIAAVMSAGISPQRTPAVATAST